jgi:hypothetical protein
VLLCVIGHYTVAVCRPTTSGNAALRALASYPILYRQWRRLQTRFFFVWTLLAGLLGGIARGAGVPMAVVFRSRPPVGCFGGGGDEFVERAGGDMHNYLLYSNNTPPSLPCCAARLVRQGQHRHGSRLSGMTQRTPISAPVTTTPFLVLRLVLVWGNRATC